MNFEYDGSPENGEIILIPDYAAGEVKIAISAGKSMISTEVPLFENTVDLGELGKGSTIPLAATDIKYNEKQPLLSFYLNKKEIRICDTRDLLNARPKPSADNEYACNFYFEFKK
ncbi:hypothetical protein [Butyrivibrio sp. AE3006]|uniref:hypothetical protein n=1 Tax=Butyrivibrio sp. AE3006 TaxID=1280673 RepID=UPI00040381AC|nr:hypothetical protein [Butyrivibrio sp. AE3006]